MMTTAKPPWFLVFGASAGCGKTTVAQLMMRALLANSSRQVASPSGASSLNEGLVLLRHRDPVQWPIITTDLPADTPAVLSQTAMAAWFPPEMHGQPFEKQLERLDWWLAEQVRPTDGGVSVLWIGEAPASPAIPVPWTLLAKGLQRLGQNANWVVWDAPPAPLCEDSASLPFENAVPVWVLPAHKPLAEVQSRCTGTVCHQALAACHPLQVVLNHVYPTAEFAQEKALMAWLQNDADGVRYCGQLPHVPLNPTGGTVADVLEPDFDTVLARMNTPLAL